MYRFAARLVVLAVAVTATAPAIGATITCESRDNRERFCPVNTRGGVVLSTQLSRAGCYQGETWGYDRRGVWVSGGCRAVFQTGGYDGNNWHSSNDYYDGDRREKRNDGSSAALAIGAILGTALIVGALSKKSGSANASSYSTDFDRGCSFGRKDRGAGKSRVYDRHDTAYDSRGEQAFAAGYNKCWSGG